MEAAISARSATGADLAPETLAYFGGDELRARVFHDKYALRDADGRVLERTPPEMWRRIARELASVERPERRAEWEELFYWLLDDFRFIPGGRIMHGAGNPKRVTLLNCYVIKIKDDSIESIFDWLKEAARTYSMGGGVGGDISMLRPRGARVNNAARSSTGAVSFMELMSLTTGTIGQSGRRGALMITIADNHPDVLDFIRVKRNLNKVRYANISVRISDPFMRAVEADETWDLVFENDKASVHRTVRAREIWNELIKGARDYAEPGVIFWDAIKRWSTSEYNGMEVHTTNPCSEIPLDPYNACDLGNVSLARFVDDSFTPQAHVNWETLDPALRYATRFLDNVLDYNADRHPLPQQKEASLRSRRIGVGFTGLGDMLIQLGLKYDSEEAIAFTDGLFDRIKQVVYDESVNLAAEKGPFPAYDPVQHFQSPFLQTLRPELLDRIQRHGLRNVALLTVPPVGSGAALAGVTSGIEPIFDLSYTRRSESLSQETFKVYHPLVREYMRRMGIDDDKDLPPSFVTAHQIQGDMRVRMQAAIQKHIDHSISSTVNLPADVSIEEVERIYFLAWKLGLKGITVYRAGSRENILTARSEEKPDIYSVGKDVLEDLYRNQRKSLTEIARLFGTNVGNVHRMFVRLGIERRRAVEAADEVLTKSVEVSSALLEIIEGELLGDGTLRRYKNGALFSYTTKHYEYAVWLSGRFEADGIECGEITDFLHDRGNTTFRFQTLVYKELGDLFDKWYSDQGQKQLPREFVLTPLRLRQWFIGDGSNVTSAKAKYIACYSAFSPEDKERLRGMLEHLLDAQVSFHESGNKFYIKAEVVKRMFDLIGPSPVRCYEYKWKGGEHVMTAREAEEWYLPNGSGAPSWTASTTAGTDQPSSSAATSTPGGQVAPDTAAAPRPRPKVTSGRTERIETPRGRIYVVVNEDELGVCEVFVHSFDVEAEAIGRLTSLALRAGVDPREVIEQLWRVQSKEVALDRSSDGTVVRVTTIAQAVALGLGRALYGETFRPDKAFPRADILPEPVRPTRQERLSFERVPTSVAERAPVPMEEGNGEGEGGRTAGGNGDLTARLTGDFPLEFDGICPDSGATLIHENGCATCRSCGYAKC
jgi:ribonucleoside-diphosphate reductase alpha chain